MTKLFYLFAVLFVLPNYSAHAEAIATGDEMNYAPTVQAQAPIDQPIHLHLDMADMEDTGQVVSRASIGQVQVASKDSIRISDADLPEKCRIFSTRVSSFYASGSHVTYKSQRFNPNADTLATKDIRLGSTVYVRMPGAKTWVQGKAIDGGPFVPGRTADLSIGYARSIDFPLGRGVAKIQVASCENGDWPSYYGLHHKGRKG